MRTALGLSLGALLAGSGSAGAGSLTLAPAGPPSPVYVWADQHCSPEQIPDAPARAFRRADGLVTLIAAHYENWSLVGRDFGHLAPRCRTLFSSAPTTSKLGKIWIEALFTTDGRRITAVGSQDLTNVTKARGCVASGPPGTCWLNNLVALQSSDMGETFTLGPTIASFGGDYPAQGQGRIGAFTTSNIVKGKDAYYMLAWVEAPPGQPRGNCLLRTDDPARADAWRAWSGRGFDADLGRAERCEPLPLRSLPNEVRSLTWDTRGSQWIAVYASRQKLEGDDAPVPGFYFSLSPDLRTWSAPARIMPAPTQPREQQSDYFVIYPSLIDPASASRNFDTIDSDHPLLFYTLHHLKDGKGTLNRDLYAQPLTLR